MVGVAEEWGNGSLATLALGGCVLLMLVLLPLLLLASGHLSLKALISFGVGVVIVVFYFLLFWVVAPLGQLVGYGSHHSETGWYFGFAVAGSMCGAWLFAIAFFVAGCTQTLMGKSHNRSRNGDRL